MQAATSSLGRSLSQAATAVPVAPQCAAPISVNQGRLVIRWYFYKRRSPGWLHSCCCIIDLQGLAGRTNRAASIGVRVATNNEAETVIITVASWPSQPDPE